MKLCKDCIHFVMYHKMEYAASHQCSKIRHEPFIEPVMGTVIPARNVNCFELRRPGKKCGPDAKLFQPKEVV